MLPGRPERRWTCLRTISAYFIRICKRFHIFWRRRCRSRGRAFNINVPDYYIPAISAFRYGKGRIVVAGSKEYFNLSESAGDAASKLARNILWWLTDDASTNQGQGNDRTNRYEDALERAGKKIRLITTSDELMVNPHLPIELVKSTVGIP